MVARLSRQFPFIRGRQVTSGQQARSPAGILCGISSEHLFERGDDEVGQSEIYGRRGEQQKVTKPEDLRKTKR